MFEYITTKLQKDRHKENRFGMSKGGFSKKEMGITEQRNKDFEIQSVDNEVRTIVVFNIINATDLEDYVN